MELKNNMPLEEKYFLYILLIVYPFLPTNIIFLFCVPTNLRLFFMFRPVFTVVVPEEVGTWGIKDQQHFIFNLL